MSQRERQERTAAVYALTKSVCKQFNINPSIELQDRLVQELHKSGDAYRGPMAVKKAVTAFCEGVKADLHDFGPDRGTKKSVADTVSAASTVVDWGDGPDARSATVDQLRATVTAYEGRMDSRSVPFAGVFQPTPTQFSANVDRESAAPVAGALAAARPQDWNPAMEGLDLAKKSHFDMLLSPRGEAATFAKARRKLAEVTTEWPEDLAPPQAPPGPNNGPLK